MFQRDPEEFLIVVGKQLIDFLFLAVALLALLEDEHGDRQRQADHRHHITQQFPDFQGQSSERSCHHYVSMFRKNSRLWSVILTLTG